MNTWINLDALWKIFVLGLLLGAGLPALFALGLRALSPRANTASASPSGALSASPADAPGIALATACFTVVLAAIGWGIYSIVNHS